jgi:hypothetical protein
MAAKVLKIDVVVDESGTARRALSEVETGVKKVEAAAKPASAAILDVDKNMAAWDERINELEGSIGGLDSATVAGAESMVTMSLGLAGVLVVAGTAGAAIYALGNYVKDATEYYIEQSGVLEVNRGEVVALKKPGMR